MKRIPIMRVRHLVSPPQLASLTWHGQKIHNLLPITAIMSMSTAILQLFKRVSDDVSRKYGVKAETFASEMLEWVDECGGERGDAMWWYYKVHLDHNLTLAWLFESHCVVAHRVLQNRSLSRYNWDFLHDYEFTQDTDEDDDEDF